MRSHFHHRFLYSLAPKRHYCYLVYLEKEQKSKIGRTCRLSHRLKNLRQSIWCTDVKVFVMRLSNSSESLRMERFLKKQLAPYHLVREWYNGEFVTPQYVSSLLRHEDGWGHVLLVKHDDHGYVVEPSTGLVRREEASFPSFSVRLD